ncbi:MAG: alanine--tRNA ligase [Armatimonadetes bacterium]|nr:alanine--tRNA ligase [Armatimonadota bacterium]
MTTRELRQKYLAFFKEKGHSEFPSGSLIPFDVTGRLDESLLFNGAGMVQFKPFFRGAAQPPNPRLTTAQKCVRTGDIEEVGDLSHLTFFEMLGNFSFGNYFKKEAIAYSWEFLTSKQWLGLDPNRLSFTVFESDDEAFGYWAEHISAAGLNPEHRIFRLGEETNYWPAGAFSAGPPGPCGPNSEMFYWTSNEEPPPSGEYTRADYIRDDKAGKWLEIWNDVFIQFEWQGSLRNPDRPAEGYIKEGMPNLPFQSIDTGMGLERTATVLSGKRSVYDTDAFQAIILKIVEAGSGFSYGENEVKDRAIRIISDHIRTACFCIADGILPANNGRGYVLRRLIRRAVLKGQRVLGFNEPFFHYIYEGVADSMGDHYTELVEKAEVITETLKNEEIQFRRTIKQGSELLQQWIAGLQENKADLLDGESAFRLYDTYGFPLEVTQELCEESGISVDVDGYESAMAEAQERSRSAGGMDTVYGGSEEGFLVLIQQEAPSKTEFIGYDFAEAPARVVAAIPEVDDEGMTTGRIGIALDRTPFYAESGGQVSDEGIIEGAGFRLKVLDLVKQDGVFVHLAETLSTSHPEEFKGLPVKDLQDILNRQIFDQMVKATVDLDRRADITRNHTATHLLHAALRKTLGKHVTQAGSLVSPEHLRFDFTHGKAMTTEEIATVEQLVNEEILLGHFVTIHTGVPIQEAKAMGAMALFGEKYGEFVRVVEIRSHAGEPVSVELCGGCHVGSTGQIGFFKILHESSAASGVRRIEAVTGKGAIAWANHQHETVRQVAEVLKSTPSDVVRAAEKNVELLKEERKKREKLLQSGGGGADAQSHKVGDVELVIQILEDVAPKEAQTVADKIASDAPNRAALLAVKGEGKLTFIAKISKDAQAKGAHAGNLVKALASLTGGGGGGGPEFATAGGRNVDALSAALAQAPEILKGQVGA